MSGGWSISAPILTEEQAAQAVSPGGLAGGTEPDRTAQAMLLGLQRLPSMYGGTVDHHTVAHRRKRNKAARKARRTNRRNA